MIRQVITLDLHPGRRAEFLEFFTPLAAAARQTDGCHEYELFTSVAAPDRVAVLETWASKEALMAAGKTLSAGGNRERFLSFLAGPPGHGMYEF